MPAKIAMPLDERRVLTPETACGITKLACAAGRAGTPSM
jgi:hypothetical protein